MIRKSNPYLLLPLLALCLAFTATVTAPARADTSASLQINFGTAPHWSGIRGTRVSEMRSSERQGYDVFRYGGKYWAYDNDRWYSSRTVRGNYMVVDERSVPREFSRVPRQHWQHYPAAWGGKPGNGNNGNNGQGRGNDHGNGNGYGNDHK